MSPDEKKICFVISPIGGDETATRKWANQTIKHLIRPAVEPLGFEVLRADEEDRAGIITTHVIQRLISAELVIADLTEWNPNVFYELAVRHVTRKPLVQMIRAREDIPFDVQSMRTVKFELDDPDVLEAARDGLARQIAAVMEEEKLETPISQAVGQQLAIDSGDPAQVQLADLAQAVQGLTAEVRRGSHGELWTTRQTPIKWMQTFDPSGESKETKLWTYEVKPGNLVVGPTSGESVGEEASDPDPSPKQQRKKKKAD